MRLAWRIETNKRLKEALTMRQCARWCSTFVLCLALVFCDTPVGVPNVGAADIGTWTITGSELVGKKILSLAINPDDPEEMWAGTENGLYRKNKYSISWTITGTELVGKKILSLAINPDDPEEMWAGTENGLYRSQTGLAGSSYVLATTAYPSAGGWIVKSPDAASYSSGTIVTITASAAAGYGFVGWSGDASGTSLSTTVAMTTNRSVTAVFQAGSLPDLTVDTLYFDPAQPTPGGSVTFHFTVRNQGSASIVADYDMRLYVDGVLSLTAADTKRLASGSSQKWYWETTWSSDTASHTFNVALDPGGVIAESNESNNSASISASAATVTYTLTPSTGIGGTMTPGTLQRVVRGGNQSFSVTPNVGYHVVDVVVDGLSQGAISYYAFTNVTSNHTIRATFDKEKGQAVIVLQIGNSLFTVNGAPKTLDSPAIIKNG
jgi:uncharacterized repeat protein (TIGR02543 family)